MKTNNDYQIKTKNGYEDFTGVQKKENTRTFTVVLDDGKTLSCTHNHKLKTPFGFVELYKLFEGDVIETADGFQEITKIIANVTPEDVYDVIDAGKDHSYYTNDIISHNCHFVGSTNTLIHPAILTSLVWHNPIRKDFDDHFDIYKEPEKGHTYVMTVDVAEGLGLDHSAYSIFDVTTIPYQQVAKYRYNKITPLLFPTEILKGARMYNDAFVLVEINSIGLQVADILHFELAYENLVKIQLKGKQGQQSSPGFTKKIAFGLKQSKQTKMIGCANIKTLIESGKMILRDGDTIQELKTFSQDKQSFRAEQGNTDDLAMCLVNFGWLVSQRQFKDNINSNIRQVLQEEQMNVMDSDIVPFGVIDNGLNDPFENERDAAGDLWVADRERVYTFDNIEFDILSNKWRL